MTEGAGAGDWGALAQLRQGLYRFFGGALLAPDEERLAALVAATDVLEEWDIDDYAFAPAWRLAVVALHEALPVDEMEGDYVRLFMAGAGGALVPPNESEYVASDGGSAATIVAKLDGDYAALGYSVKPGLAYASDHVAIELEAMATLCHREAHAWDGDDPGGAVAVVRQEWTFLDHHLARWLPPFASRLRAVASPGLYPTLVDATSAFVLHDVELITMITKARLTQPAP
ncbi:MAG: molecular chaperone TorD family protein [Actinobacteria bacterium]|nr:molecular chaperone TorD family protein [Actinomycetota bacterium]